MNLEPNEFKKIFLRLEKEEHIRRVLLEERRIIRELVLKNMIDRTFEQEMRKTN